MRLDRLDAVLRRSVASCGLVELLERLGGPLRDRRADRAAAAAAFDAAWVRAGCHSAVVEQPRLHDWLAVLRTRGLARRLGRDDEFDVVVRALDVLARLPADGVRLPVMAAATTGDAHGLDRGRAVGTLVVHALSFLVGRQFPQDAADWRDVWAEAGVACDDLSCDVLVANLPGWPAEPLRLTLRQVAAWQPPGRVRRAFVCENPAVVAAAVDAFGPAAPPIVCVGGMPSTAALMVIRGLVGAGAKPAYHGDFDWRGLAIADVVLRKVEAARAWRYGAADYEKAVAAGHASHSLRGRTHEASWDERLAPAMRVAGVAVYEEHVLEDLLDDLCGAVVS